MSNVVGPLEEDKVAQAEEAWIAMRGKRYKEEVSGGKIVIGD